jgi:hypothetical protein
VTWIVAGAFASTSIWLITKCHSSALHSWLDSEPELTEICWLARAAVGKMAHAIISSVAAVTAMRPAAVSRLLWFVLRSAGIFPTSIVLTCQQLGDTSVRRW